MISKKFNKKYQPIRTEFASGAEARVHFVLHGYQTKSMDQSQLILTKQGPDQFVDTIKVSKVDETRWIVGEWLP